MNGPQHHIVGFLAGAAYGAYIGGNFGDVALMGIAASATSWGPLSPDLDQKGPWELLRSIAPRRIAKAMAHRFITHWWFLPVLFFWQVVPHLSPTSQVLAIPMLIGWSSHIVADFFFGSTGVPLLPAGWHVGLKLPQSGLLEEKLVPTAVALGIVWVLFAPFAGYPALPVMAAG